MLITSHLKFDDKMATIKLEIILNEEAFGAMNKAVFDTTEKTLLKTLEAALKKEMEKSLDVAEQTRRL